MPKKIEKIFDAIREERSYQKKLWGESITTGKHIHSVEEFALYIQDYLQEAVHSMSREPDPKARKKGLHIMRKIATMAIACMEQNGIYRRDMKDLDMAKEKHNFWIGDTMKHLGVNINTNLSKSKEQVVLEKYDIKGITKSDFQLGFIKKLIDDKTLREVLDSFKCTLCNNKTVQKIKKTVENYIYHKLVEENIPLLLDDIAFSISHDRERISILFHTLPEIHEITIDPWPILASLYKEMCKKAWDYGKNQVVLLETAYLESKAENTTLIPRFIDYPEDVKNFLDTCKNGKVIDYVDNKRIARVDDADAMRKYMNQKDRGCCGVFDTCYKGKDGQWYLIGFNYGH